MQQNGISLEAILPHLFRQEYTKITAVLCRYFGLRHIEIAEDIASETFLKASENWAVNGVPNNPTAWLYTVAKNKAKDYFKHLAVFETQVKKELPTETTQDGHTFEFNTKIISDSQLAMIFAVSNPKNKTEPKIVRAHHIICVFRLEKIQTPF
jgi:predicted RNA polymerase sigma factor